MKRLSRIAPLILATLALAPSTPASARRAALDDGTYARREPIALEIPRPASARDAWSEAVAGIRLLRRRMRHPSGAPLDVHAAYVDLCDARVSLRATAPEERGRRVSSWARHVGAAVAINGDFFVRGARPLGPARGDGRDWPDANAHYYDAIFAMAPGRAPRILERPPRTPAWTDLVASQERIVVEGRPRLSPYVNHSRSRHPRSAIGLTRDGRTLILVAVDGRSRRSAGATTPELGPIVRDLGAWNALRMDGGGSTALWVSGHGIVNTPSDGHERAVANHIGVIVSEPSPAGSRHAWCRE
ncbi:MAG: phosphodiester glycosidase family protein [Deltaproteobacteria bacterium]|nr:phosphodiester glycosidase family protein [Deltaproteobacteria bacterium]